MDKTKLKRQCSWSQKNKAGHFQTSTSERVALFLLNPVIVGFDKDYAVYKSIIQVLLEWQKLRTAQVGTTLQVAKSTGGRLDKESSQLYGFSPQKLGRMGFTHLLQKEFLQQNFANSQLPTISSTGKENK
ncbi:hypothetical protein HPP92_028704 [Vanilla planifolia]|uniref:Uncharacterized protein n=1 Tax=Vanilla planifolia TaxID=51239 RepID=A0A835P873_VANPL|nr:hypothetical protein HPP92_028704 [Vanilla planifolia]